MNNKKLSASTPDAAKAKNQNDKKIEDPSKAGTTGIRSSDLKTSSGSSGQLESDSFVERGRQEALDQNLLLSGVGQDGMSSNEPLPGTMDKNVVFDGSKRSSIVEATKNTGSSSLGPLQVQTSGDTGTYNLYPLDQSEPIHDFQGKFVAKKREIRANDPFSSNKQAAGKVVKNRRQRGCHRVGCGNSSNVLDKDTVMTIQDFRAEAASPTMEIAEAMKIEKLRLNAKAKRAEEPVFVFDEQLIDMGRFEMENPLTPVADFEQMPLSPVFANSVIVPEPPINEDGSHDNDDDDNKVFVNDNFNRLESISPQIFVYHIGNHYGLVGDENILSHNEFKSALEARAMKAIPNMPLYEAMDIQKRRMDARILRKRMEKYEDRLREMGRRVAPNYLDDVQEPITPPLPEDLDQMEAFFPSDEENGFGAGMV